MSWKPTIIACVLALIALIGALVVRQLDRAGRQSSTAQTLLLGSMSMPVEGVTRITLVRGGADRYVFERHRDGWMQIEPFAHPVDGFSVGQLISLANGVRVSRSWPVSEQTGERAPEAMGFAPPLGRLRLEWPGGDVEIELGRATVGGRAYVRLNGEGAISIVSHELHDRALEMDPREWRLRRLFTHAGADSVRLRSVRPDGVMVLERERRQWVFREPVRTRTDETIVTDFLAEASRAQHGGFIMDQPRDLAGFGLAAPVAILELTTTVEGEPVTERLLLGSQTGIRANDRFAMMEGRPTVVVLPQEVLLRLFPDHNRFLALNASGIAPENVKILRISGPEGEFRLERRVVGTEEQWVSLDHEERRVESGRVLSLLDMLTQFQAVGFDLAAYPAQYEIAVVTLFGYDGRALDAVRLARPDVNGNWIFDNGDGIQRFYPPGVQPPLRPADYGLPALTR